MSATAEFRVKPRSMGCSSCQSMKITLLAAEQGEVSFGEYNHIL